MAAEEELLLQEGGGLDQVVEVGGCRADEEEGGEGEVGEDEFEEFGGGEDEGFGGGHGYFGLECSVG